MPRTLTPTSSLDDFRREAKRWLKALRANDDEALARYARAVPDAHRAPTLRDVQHALARELGFAGWTELKHRKLTEVDASRPDAALVARFLDNACPDHHVRGAPDQVRARHTAMRLLARYPEIAHAGFQTEIVCGNLIAVEQALGANPSLAGKRDATPSNARSEAGERGDLLIHDLGPKGWEPLLYLCFTRLPLPASSDNAVAIARVLLDRGADPNAYFMAGDSRYTPLVGAIGEGEENRPPHPQRDALVRLLLERGAEPYDKQVVYNIHFHGNVLWFLELIYERSLEIGRRADWDDPDWSMLDMGGYGSGARWHLDLAIEHGDVRLAEWCLTHGASANAAPARDARMSQDSLYVEAVRRGQMEIAELLVRHGAIRSEVALSGVHALAAAALRLDEREARALVAAAPDLLKSALPLTEAARRDRADAVGLLLDLGVSPDVEDERKERPLHVAAYNNSLNVARLLLARGAAIDPVESSYGNTPLAGAVYAQHAEMIDLLAERSRDLWELTYAGKTDRVRTLLSEVAENGRIAGNGHTPLMWLPPDDEANAIEIARLFLDHGADATVRNSDGMTAADRAERMGMWMLAELLRAAEQASPGPALIARFERLAANLEEAYRTGTPEAMRRHWSDTWHLRDWKAMRRYIQLDLGRHVEGSDGDSAITIDDARRLVAREHGFESWAALVEHMSALPPGAKPPTVKPVTLYSVAEGSTPRAKERTRDWDMAIERLRAGRSTGIDAAGQMTDELLDRISGLEQVTSLDLTGSVALTDAGVRHLARMPQLRELDLSGCSITDGALVVLRELGALEKLSLARTGVTDAGAAALATCRRLERVDLSGSSCGDGAIRALAGMPALRQLRSGNTVTDAGLPLLHELPVFKKWHGGDVVLSLLSMDAEPNMLMLRGTFTDRGMAALAGLDGLFGLNVDDRALGLTAASLAPLTTLPNLGFLAFDATDDAMPYIAAMPVLRFLMCQDTVAGDDGFAALSRSASIEYIWGRRCYNLGSRGFAALATMPRLRALSVSCRNVDNAALSTLPSFPALRELMPMDVPDEGFRFIGRCEQLEELILMYCRETTDAATEQITGLSRLTKYLATYTRITDRTPQLLSGMESLERVELGGCPGVTDAGIAALARLPRLRELHVGGMQNVTRAGLAAFAPGVEIVYSP